MRLLHGDRDNAVGYEKAHQQITEYPINNTRAARENGTTFRLNLRIRLSCA